MKNILIINGHHRNESFSKAIVEAYIKGVENSDAEIKQINMFNTDVKFIESNLESNKTEIKNAQDLITWAHHIVWVYPIWWYTMPSKLKAFFEAVFVSGFAYKYHKKTKRKNPKWDKLLKGKTSRIFATMDAPVWYYKIILRNPNYKMMKSSLNYCGITSITATYFGPVKGSTQKQRLLWLKKVSQIGQKLK
ncbi:MAG: NAD(P)H-dependent oxidoreductase [Flavobacteriaceae bacterium]